MRLGGHDHESTEEISRLTSEIRVAEQAAREAQREEDARIVETYLDSADWTRQVVAAIHEGVCTMTTKQTEQPNFRALATKQRALCKHDHFDSPGWRESECEFLMAADALDRAAEMELRQPKVEVLQDQVDGLDAEAALMREALMEAWPPGEGGSFRDEDWEERREAALASDAGKDLLERVRRSEQAVKDATFDRALFERLRLAEAALDYEAPPHQRGTGTHQDQCDDCGQPWPCPVAAWKRAKDEGRSSPG